MYLVVKYESVGVEWLVVGLVFNFVVLECYKIRII